MVDTVLEQEVPARFQQVAVLRRAADAFLHESTDDRRRHLVLLVISELCTNAIEAVQDARACIVVRMRDLADHVEIEVEDRGPGFDRLAKIDNVASEDDEHGRGLHVVRSIADEVSVRRDAGCTRVHCSIPK